MPAWLIWALAAVLLAIGEVFTPGLFFLGPVALAAVVGFEDRWKSDGRWFRYITFLEEGGRTLTRSHLIVKARRR